MDSKEPRMLREQRASVSKRYRTVYDYFDLWAWDETLQRIHDALYIALRENVLAWIVG